MSTNSSHRPSFKHRHIDLVADRHRAAEEVCTLLDQGWTQGEVAQALAEARIGFLHPGIDAQDIETLAAEPTNRVSRAAVSQLATAYRTILALGMTPDRDTFDAIYRVVAQGGTAGQRRELVEQLKREPSMNRRSALIQGMNEIYKATRGPADGATRIIAEIDRWRIDNLSTSDRRLILRAVERRFEVSIS